MVTIFKNFNEVVEHKTIATILEEIKTGKHKPGIIYLRKSLAEKKEEAYNMYRKVLDAEPDNAMAMYSLASYYEETGQKDLYQQQLDTLLL
nr:tetratricopeptide repeat protein [Flavobacterium sp.]